jgi:hypothetical protein
MLRFEITPDALDRFQQLAREGVAQARRRMIEDAGRSALNQIIDKNPVDTGRSRAAWVAALNQLGGATGLAAATGGPGTGFGAGEGAASLTDDGDQTEATAMNSVDYIAYLEYGTSRIAPFAMVRSALSAVRATIASLFRL